MVLKCSRVRNPGCSGGPFKLHRPINQHHHLSQFLFIGQTPYSSVWGQSNLSSEQAHTSSTTNLIKFLSSNNSPGSSILLPSAFHYPLSLSHYPLAFLSTLPLFFHLFFFCFLLFNLLSCYNRAKHVSDWIYRNPRVCPHPNHACMSVTLEDACSAWYSGPVNLVL